MIRVSVPATTANLGPGFDALGLALGLRNELWLAPADAPAVEVEGEGAEVLPRDASHLAYRAARAVVERAAGRGRAAPAAFRIRQRNRIPLARGLGSSAAAIVGGAAAANAALGDPLDRQALLDLATGLEGHPDNAAPALLGGLVVCAREAGGGVRWARLDPPRLRIVLAIPDFTVSTAEARRLLPAAVPYADAVYNVTRAALLVAALAGGQAGLLDEATRDRLHQPYRARLVPGLDEVFAAARRAGAAGVALSGSGPTVVAFGGPAGNGRAIGEAMAEAFRATGAGCRVIEAEADGRGTVVSRSGEESA